MTRLTSSAIRERILDALRGDPAFDSSLVQISVATRGVVTIEGCVHTYAGRCAIEENVACVQGVVSVCNSLDVHLTIGDHRTDSTLERVLRDMVDCLARMPAERPKATVAGGWVTLHGAVPHAFQKRLVENVAREVAGIRGISNQIILQPESRTGRINPEAAPVVERVILSGSNDDRWLASRSSTMFELRASGVPSPPNEVGSR